ncbi:MAG: alpha/beta hydrolase [Betaproteobacteria bacterium]|nr:alpha/beta hydrolase [Betaproteobacteria bacterium]
MSKESVSERSETLTLGKIRWLEAGEGPPVLLLHGMGMYSSANLFDFVIPAVAARMHVIAPDWLGFGLGVRNLDEGPTFELMLDHLREFMDVVGLKRAHVLGHSMGGWLAAQFAYQSPSRVEKLIMLCAAGMNRAPATSIRFETVPTKEELRSMFRGSMKHPDLADTAILESAVATAERMVNAPGALRSLDPLLHQMETPSLRDRYMLQRRLPHIAVPSLMAWGEADVFEPYPTWNGEWESLKGDMSRSSKPWIIPGARFVRLPTGHWPHVEQPEKTAGLILDFFAGQ